MSPTSIFSEPWLPSAAEVAAFRRDGFVRLRGVLPPETVAWLHQRVQVALPQVVKAFDNGNAFRQAIGLWQTDALLNQVTRSRRLAGIVAALTGAPSLCLWHDQALIKAAGGGPTLLHTDWHYMPVAAPPGWGLWLPLHDIAPDDGALGYVPGTHLAHDLRRIPGDQAGHQQLQAWCAERGQDLDIAGVRAGDLAIHDVRIVHGTRPNTGGRARSIYNIFYLRGDARREDQPQTRFLEQYWATNWPEVAPGARFADAAAHPQVWTGSGVGIASGDPPSCTSMPLLHRLPPGARAEAGFAAEAATELEHRPR